MEFSNCGNSSDSISAAACCSLNNLPLFQDYFMNLEISQITSAITAATSKRPVHTPALKISPINSHELSENISTARRMKLYRRISVF